jgi:deazaflavin-dependent oxidoreductase (nitroreductase family)
MARYLQPDWFTRHLFNPAVDGLTRIGVSVWGSRILRVRGRQTGEPRSTPVNVLAHQGARYLVAPRGNTQWVRNLRAAGQGELLLGSRVEPFSATEVDDDGKIPILRAYLRRWQFEVGAFFKGMTASSPDTELRRIAPDHPVFQIRRPDAMGSAESTAGA